MKSQTGKIRISRSVAVVVLPVFSIILAGCETIPSFTGPKGFKANPYILTINFDTVDGCKILSVDEEITPLACGPGFCVHRNEWIIWKSNPADIKYEIFFDPILDIPLKSWRSGYLPRPIDKDAPIADYKYSIVRNGCTPNATNTFDPHIRVNN